MTIFSDSDLNRLSKEKEEAERIKCEEETKEMELKNFVLDCLREFPRLSRKMGIEPLQMRNPKSVGLFGNRTEYVKIGGKKWPVFQIFYDGEYPFEYIEENDSEFNYTRHAERIIRRYRTKEQIKGFFEQALKQQYEVL